MVTNLAAPDDAALEEIQEQQLLDHILDSPTVRGVTYQVVRVNAEYHDQVRDHDPQVVDITP